MKRKSLPISVIAGTTLLAALHATPASAQDAAPPNPASPPSGQAGAESGGGPSPRASAALDIPVAELMRRPDAYVGRNVTVTSEVDEVFTPWTVKLDEDQLLAGGVDNDILVISALPLVAQGFDPSLRNKKVRATGTVRVLQAADFLREYGRGMTTELIRQYEGKPALIATSLTVVDEPPSGAQSSSGAGASAGSSAAGGGDVAGAAGAAGQRGYAVNCPPDGVYCPPSEPVWSTGAE